MRVRAIVRYGFVCAVLGAVVAAGVLALLGGSERGVPAALPPVREIQLVKAVQAAGCELRRTRGGERAQAARAAPAPPRFYDDAPSRAALAAAVRRGVIVISYRPAVDRERLEQLRSLQTVIPSGTIVAPDASATRYEIAADAYRRRLGCTRFTPAAIDAIRLFRGRYVGTGPDR
jgi:hypothetical protein